MNDKHYLTTPIYYVNDRPHIGHAYTTIVADVLARYWRRRLGNDKVFFLTGTDEHGAKIERAACKLGMSPKEFADSVSAKYQATWKSLKLTPDYFIRTTDPEHEKIVVELVSKLHETGDIYKGEYAGRYCVACEEYKQQNELLDGNKCPIHKTIIEEVKEEVYFFRLSNYQKQLLYIIDKGEMTIFPESRKNEIVNFVKSGLQDIAISRSNVGWGIKLPWDKQHTLYVWVDALFNYYSAPKMLSKDYFPPDEQFIGKDILRFHVVIWPAMLLALGLLLPRQLVVNGYFTVNGEKMSKTLGNVIDPLKITSTWGNDALRYYLLRDLSFSEDGDFSWDRFKQRYESELSNALGNLVQRVLSMVNRYEIDIVEKNTPELESVNLKLESYDFSGALDVIWEKIARANAEIEKQRPWQLSKEGKLAELSIHLNELYADIQSIADALSSLLPETSQKILSQLKSLEPSPIFPRIDTE